MCGICGQYNFKLDEPVQPSVIKKMADSISHRGPDAEGFHVSGPVGLGHRRLKIIDLSGGAQPMFNEDRSLVVVFNGEIYNYQELRKELIASGHVFQSASDTEVLLHGFEQWGSCLVERLRGMFVFAIWNERTKQLFLARDRLGIKPLYYCRADGVFLFASEIKAIMQSPLASKALDYQAIDDFLTYMYIPAPKSIFKNIRKLPAGHFVQVGPEKFDLQEYWDVIFEPTAGRNEQRIVEQVRENLADAVKVRMISDVPLGAFLSGGIDSSAVVGTMSALSDTPVNTASIGFNESRFDELPYARMVAERFSTKAHEKIVTPDAAKILQKLAWHYDEPFADSSMAPTYYVSQAAREQVTVCLSGDGGDENFAGYRRYRFDYLENQVRAVLPLFLRRPLFGAMGRIYPKADWLPQMFRAKTLLLNLSNSPERAYFNSMSWFSQSMKSRMYSPDLKRELAGYDSFSVMQQYFQRAKDWDPLSRIQYVDMKTYLVDDILTKVDRASMAHALEVRVPLLDHQFIEYAATIPHDLKLRGGEGKYILKKAVRGIVPDAILDRPKQGFSIPLAEWLRNDLKTVFEENVLADNSFSAGIFQQAYIRSAWSQHQRGIRDYAYHLWALLMLECWAKKFI